MVPLTVLPGNNIEAEDLEDEEDGGIFTMIP